ncbi:MAG: hypothetical protein JXR46_06350 [Calditrichaceae bacterium]|nr:hypothetical protein [Calditrichaceae bacterium]MBN2708648.1 hypothetical protein [Calditrichaceae bacterium]RQV92016.1 MAG: hypothetical protein EH224_16575 [Calditrichota bacterium]
MKWLVLLLSALAVLPLYAQNDSLIQVGSFNIEWFPCKDDGELMKQYDINLRVPPTGKATNMDALFSLLKELDIELLGVVEIVDPFVLEKEAQLRLGRQFKVIYAPGNGSQSVGFLYDSSVLSLIGQPEIYASIMIDPDSWLRPAFRACFKYKDSGFDFHAIIVHLKAAPGGWNLRKQQWEVLSGILKEIPEKYGDQDIILMGDFNNVSKLRVDEFMPVIDSLNFFWATSEIADSGFSNYWQPDYGVNRIEGSLIDHIFISNSVREEYVPESIILGGMCSEGKLEYSDDEIPAYYELISDHCPVFGSFRAAADND